MLAVVISGSGPIKGEDDPIAAGSSARARN